jgi:hypothetical protein
MSAGTPLTPSTGAHPDAVNASHTAAAGPPWRNGGGPPLGRKKTLVTGGRMASYYVGSRTKDKTKP